MTLEVVYGQQGNSPAALQLAGLAEDMLDEGTLYLGYPVLTTADDRVDVDALLVCQTHGLIAFRFAEGRPESEEDWERLADEQDRIYNALESHLSRHETLRVGRRFAVDVGTVTLFAVSTGRPPHKFDANFSTFDDLPAFISDQPGLTSDIYHNLEAALQRLPQLVGTTPKAVLVIWCLTYCLRPMLRWKY